MSSILVLDMSFLVYRGHHSYKNYRPDRCEVGGTFSFFRELLKLKNLFDPDTFVFCFDRGCQNRKNLLPTYKSNRKKDWNEQKQQDRESVKRQLFELRRELLPRIGFRNVFSQRYFEADDIIASVVQNSLGEQDDAIIVANDSDIWQLLAPNVMIYNVTKTRCLNAKYFKKKWGIEPVMWSMVLAMAGCRTDGIEGIPRVGRTLAIKWITGRLNPESSTCQKIDDNLRIALDNLKLTKLPFEGVEKFTIQPDKPNRKEWRIVMEELGISSIGEWDTKHE